MEMTARVIPLGGKVGQIKEKGSEPALPSVGGGWAPALQPLERGALIVISDQQLDALGTLFQMSPLRKVMTFEAYLIMKGFAPDFAC